MSWLFDNSSSTKQTATTSEQGQQLNESTGSTASAFGNITASGKNSSLSVVNNMTDHGATEKAFSLAEKLLDSQNNKIAVDYKTAVAGLESVAGLGYDGLKVNADLLAKSLESNEAQNANYLGKVSDWSSALQQNNQAVLNLSEVQTKRAYDFAAGEGDANRALLADATRTMGNLFDNTSRGLLNFAADQSANSFTMQNEAVKSINDAAQIAAKSSQNAMNMIFEASKTADERILTNSTKWILGGLVVMVGFVVFAPKFLMAS